MDTRGQHCAEDQHFQGLQAESVLGCLSSSGGSSSLGTGSEQMPNCKPVPRWFQLFAGLTQRTWCIRGLQQTYETNQKSVTIKEWEGWTVCSSDPWRTQTTSMWFGPPQRSTWCETADRPPVQGPARTVDTNHDLMMASCCGSPLYCRFILV